MKRLWLLLCVMGAVVPYAVFVPWLADNGIDVSLFWEQATASPIAAFAWLDVIATAVTVFVLAALRMRQGDRRNWAVMGATCLVGPSLGLPLYLYFREP